MSDKKPHVTILDADDPEFAEKIGEAIGAEPGDTINVTGPQFERPDDAPPEPSVPADDEAWRQLVAVMKPTWPRPGDKVNYAPRKGRPPDKFCLTVRTQPIRLRSGVWVVWLAEMHGPVPIEHLSEAAL